MMEEVNDTVPDNLTQQYCCYLIRASVLSVVI